MSNSPGGSTIVLYVVSYVNAHPQSLGPTLKLFVNVKSLFGCCIMSVSMVALSSGRMLMTAVDGSHSRKSAEPS